MKSTCAICLTVGGDHSVGNSEYFVDKSHEA